MEKLKKYLRNGLIFFLIIFLTQGCVMFHPEYGKKDEDGFYIHHYNACGPIALEKALTNLGEDVTRKDISRKIQARGNFTRKTISLIHYEGILITWPSEIKTIIKKYGYKTKTINNISELKEGDTAIVLIRGSVAKREWHWTCYPIDGNLENYYPDKTKVLKIYKIIGSP